MILPKRAVSLQAVAQMTLPGGRRLAYQALGTQGAPAALVLHGTPGSSRQLADLDRPARGRGLALIVPDRAGYGGCAYEPSQTIASSARDLGELIRHLGLHGCAVIGLSGGGPTALACGVLLAGQVTAVATVGSVAPMVPRSPLLPPDRLVIRTARRSQAATRLMFAAAVHAGRTRPERTPDRFASLLASLTRSLRR
jgi:pimeloyl-ACP methyl ester carboxylesterase